MEKQFIPYELALKLKELGFDYECMGFYEAYKKTIGIITINGINRSDTFYSKNSYAMWGGISQAIDETDDWVLYISANDLTGYYDNIVKAPIWQQAFDFMAFKCSIHGNVITSGRDKIYMSSEYREGYGGTKSNDETYTDIYQCRIDLLEDMIELFKRPENY